MIEGFKKDGLLYCLKKGLLPALVLTAMAYPFWMTDNAALHAYAAIIDGVACCWALGFAVVLLWRVMKDDKQ